MTIWDDIAKPFEDIGKDITKGTEKAATGVVDFGEGVGYIFQSGGEIIAAGVTLNKDLANKAGRDFVKGGKKTITSPFEVLGGATDIFVDSATDTIIDNTKTRIDLAVAAAKAAGDTKAERNLNKAADFVSENEYVRDGVKLTVDAAIIVATGGAAAAAEEAAAAGEIAETAEAAAEAGKAAQAAGGSGAEISAAIEGAIPSSEKGAIIGTATEGTETVTEIEEAARKAREVADNTQKAAQKVADKEATVEAEISQAEKAEAEAGELTEEQAKNVEKLNEEIEKANIPKNSKRSLKTIARRGIREGAEFNAMDIVIDNILKNISAGDVPPPPPSDSKQKTIFIIILSVLFMILVGLVLYYLL